MTSYKWIVEISPISKRSAMVWIRVSVMVTVNVSVRIVHKQCCNVGLPVL